MKALLKYEIRKTWATKLILLGITAVEELAFLVGLYLMGREVDNYVTAVSISLLVVTAIAGVILIGVQSVLTLHRDMNTKQGYMLYMTPRNSYQILGAKFLENGLSLFLAGAFYFLLGFLDITLMLGRLGQLEQLWNFFRDLMTQFNAEIQITWENMLCLTGSMLTSWLATVAIAYLADIISSALLNGKKFNGLVTFLFFILLSLLLGYIQRAVLPTNAEMMTMLLIDIAVSLAYAAVMYVVSAVIMERYLSV